MTRGGAVEDEELEPTRGTNVSVRRRGDSTGGASARDGGEKDALTHAITMGAGLGAQERHAQIGRAALRHCERDRRAIRPVFIRDGEIRLGEAGEQVRRHEDLDTVFLRINFIFGIRARDEDATVLEDKGFGMVEAGDDCICHDGDALTDRLGRVVEEGVEVWGRGEAEAGLALEGAVEDEISAVW